MSAYKMCFMYFFFFSSIRRHTSSFVDWSSDVCSSDLVREGGRAAVTHYRVIKRFRAHTHISVKLETGRTHQIRVHLAHIRHPLVGDPVYGRRLAIPADATLSLQEALRSFKRQALHARRLGLAHPQSGEFLRWEAPLPDDMQHFLQALDHDLRREPGRGA